MKNKGFSLIEIIVAITIVALISVAAAVSLQKQRVTSREARRITDLDAIRNAIEASAAAGNEYVSTSGSIMIASNALTSLVSGGFISTVPNEMNPLSSDTICSTYTYRSPISGTTRTSLGLTLDGDKEYALSFRTEYTSSELATGQRHPQNSAVMVSLTTQYTNCAFNEAFIFGPNLMP